LTKLSASQFKLIHRNGQSLLYGKSHANGIKIEGPLGRSFALEEAIVRAMPRVAQCRADANGLPAVDALGCSSDSVVSWQYAPQCFAKTNVGYEAAELFFNGSALVDPTRARYLPVPRTAHLALRPNDSERQLNERPNQAHANLAEEY
jgi:hypothetical protein